MTERPLRFPSRMTPAETLMWVAERDPVLRSAFVTVTVLDRPADADRFRRRMQQAVAALPRLRHRVVERAVGPPSWEPDPDFDLAFHVRHIALPAPGTDRRLLDFASVFAQEAFDPARPLWQYLLVDGLEGGRGALLAKMHHAITDGVGGVRLSAQFVDMERDAPPPPDPDAPAGDDGADAGGGVLGAAARATGGAVRAAVGGGRAIAGVTGALVRPALAVTAARSAVRQALVTDAARSPLWRGRRGLRRHFDTLSVDLEAVRTAAASLGGTVNDLYVTAVAGAAGAYHIRSGTPVGELRMSMPVSTRSDRSAGGNAFAPARVLVPAGERDPRARFAAVHARLARVKSEGAFSFVDPLAGALLTVPPPVVVRLARQQVETVDFTASNVRGAPFELFIAGARVLATFPMGPTAGTPFNASTLSSAGRLDIGLNVDVAAVADPLLLHACLTEAFAELLALG